MASSTIVTVNTGSSSIKLTVFSAISDVVKMSRLLDISISNIGQPVSLLQVKPVTMTAKIEEVQAANHTVACDIILQTLLQTIPTDTIVAIGHRLVHGGGKFAHSTLLKDITEDDWLFLSQIDPLHSPAAQQIAIRFAKSFPSIPQVACFDTAFFNHLPDVAKLIPIPKKYDQMGVRRYGFHGLSYTSILEVFREKAGETAANGRVILAHLGSGASVTAMQFGKPVDTTMGFTPASGLPMSTRSGDLDPGIFGFLHRQTNMTADEFDHMVNFESGLVRVSGVTGDMQMLLTLEDANKDAALAIELFVKSVKKSIGAFAAILGGVDSLVFSGGIGEQSAVLRSRICEGMEYMGIEINEATNERHDFLISTERSQAGVHVIPADEARVIAKQTITLIRKYEA
ncbi:MAG TPA: acetate/propionate family kinase [Candidatus Saccharimonadales bacterium]|nr:acetate/propionate family kinase [Candidatus Saccharimonadales bacterium]